MAQVRLQIPVDSNSPTAVQSRPPLLRRLSSRLSGVFGSYQGSVCCSPIWYGILALVTEMAPRGMNMAYLSKLQTDQFGENAYWLANGSMILMSLLATPSLALGAYLSQPHRVGRKNVMLYVVIGSTILNVVPALTTNAWIILYSQIAGSFIGCDKSGALLFVTVTSWCTDWCNPKDKAKYFGIIMGTLFGTISVAPFLPLLVGLDSKGGPSVQHQICVLSAGAKLIGPLYLLLFFPRTVVSAQMPQTPASLSRRFSISPGFTHESEHGESDAFQEAAQPTPFSTSKYFHDVKASMKYLLTRHTSATTVYLMINFTDSAVQDCIMTYIVKERGFEISDINVLIGIIGIFGFLMQCFGVPLLSSCGVRSETLLVIAVFAMVLHFGTYAFVASKFWILALEPIGSLGYVAVIAAMAIVSGQNSSDDIPRDQGTLLGALNVLKLGASCIGPLLIAGTTSAYKTLPSPFNFPGLGFSVLMGIMLIAWIIAIQLRCKQKVEIGSSLSTEDSQLKPGLAA